MLHILHTTLITVASTMRHMVASDRLLADLLSLAQRTRRCLPK